MTPYRSFFWKKNPFVRLLLPFATGILLQHQFHPGIQSWIIAATLCAVLLLLFYTGSMFNRFRFGFIAGLLISGLFISAGGLITHQEDVTNHKSWIGHHYQEGDFLVARLLEPPAEKAKTFKANAAVEYLVRNGKLIPVTAKVVLYFTKDSLFNLHYGSRLLIQQQLQPVKSPGNPGSFNYREYCLFQGITHQAFLSENNYEVLPGKGGNGLNRLLYTIREKVVEVIQQHIPGKKESSLAEALLIGYKNDLDQSLVQSYTNTGVVHIIAISGLHLGLLYWLLTIIFKPLLRKKQTRWAGMLLIVSVLWLFSLLTGAQPSILRAAVMFTCIIAGETLSRKSSVYNTLALSALILLCVNPYWLWDVGFQLSYSAVLSIVIFMKPVYNLLYIKNKILDAAWKLSAVTIAAQILTLPVSIYHFHQLPVLFLLTNFLAVPLSSVVLLGEILLCLVSFIPVAAAFTGKILSFLISVMNTYIENIEAIRFSLWDGMQISIMQTILLLAFISFSGYWLMEKKSRALPVALGCLLLFAGLRSISFIEATEQRKLIVYNVPRRAAIDFIEGRKYKFVGDSSLLSDDFARNFHLKPSRILQRLSASDSLAGFIQLGNTISFAGKHILLINETIRFSTSQPKQQIDLLVLSGNPRLYFKYIIESFSIKQVVFDGSVPAWKSRYWKKDCDSLNIKWHDVSMDGAFVMNVR